MKLASKNSPKGFEILGEGATIIDLMDFLNPIKYYFA